MGIVKEIGVLTTLKNLSQEIIRFQEMYVPIKKVMVNCKKKNLLK